MLERISDLRFTGISDDSRKVKRGDVFFAINGSRFDGARFVTEAIKKGAVAIVTAEDFDPGFKGERDVRIIRVSNPRIALAYAAREFYHNPSSRVKVVGITGTNGKTTCSYLLAALLKEAGFESGIIGTISYNWKDTVIESGNTTPGALDLQRLLNAMAADRVKYCAMEVSSHSLDQDRVLGIDFNAALFTNITGEHLDYHKTFENYVRAKNKLFRNMKKDALAVLNADDPNFSDIQKGAQARILTYGIRNDADVRAVNIHSDSNRTEFTVATRGGAFDITSPLIGDFNVYNILAAVGYALEEKIPILPLQASVAAFKGAEGRLEAVGKCSDPKVFIDYAHTDDALKNVLETLRKVTAGRLIVVFGCGGDRDRTKRPRMGNVASRLADYVVITSDNPRSEDPMAIAREVEAGLEKDFSDYKIITDRLDAIRDAINVARPGDIVLVAGKGHEKYQVIGDKQLPYSDRDSILEILKETCPT